MGDTIHLTDDEAEGMANLFGLLSDKTRVRLLAALAGGEACVTDLQKRLGLPQPTVSHHLTILRNGQLVVSRRGGKRVLYALGVRVHSLQTAIRIAAGELSISVSRRADPVPALPEEAGATVAANDSASPDRQAL